MITRREVVLKSGLFSSFFASGCLIADDARRRRSEESLRQELPCWERLEIDTTETKVFSVADEDEMMKIPRDEINAAYEKHQDPEHPTWTGYIDTRNYSTAVLLKARVYNTIDRANQHYEKIVADFENPEDRTRGDKAKQDDRGQEAELIFTISNAVGHVKSYVPEQAPDDRENLKTDPIGRASTFSKRMHDYWGGADRFEQDDGFCMQT